jgi:hypothetical protein
LKARNEEIRRIRSEILKEVRERVKALGQKNFDDMALGKDYLDDCDATIDTISTILDELERKI